MTTQVFITGAGVVSPIGSGIADFERAVYSGRSGIGESVLFPGHITSEVRDFKPEQWLGPKGLRPLDRAARLLSVAVHLALEDCAAAHTSASEVEPGIGLVCGTMLGGLHSIASFDWTGLTEGAQYVSPLEFPNTVICSAAGQAAIRFRLGGVNATISAGMSSGLCALGYAADFIRLKRARLLLAGGVEELCDETITALLASGAASRSGTPRPFDLERDGVVPAEGAALLALEAGEEVHRRGIEPRICIAGFGQSHAAGVANASPQDRAIAAQAAIERALAQADTAPEQIAAIIFAGSGSRDGDEIEHCALRKVFGEQLARTPACAPKAVLGEALGASGATAAVIAYLALLRGHVPPTPGYARADCGLGFSSSPQPLEGVHILVNAFDCSGINAALVLRRVSPPTA